MIKKCFLFCCFLYIFSAFSQKDEILVLLNKTTVLLQRIENNTNNATDILKKAANKYDTTIIKRAMANVVAMAENAEKNAKQSENFSDLAEQKAKKSGCQDAAQEADDAEDYCRHLVFQSHEIALYAKKILAETDFDAMQSYTNKALAYSLEAYESIKNAQIELADAINDLNNCP